MPDGKPENKFAFDGEFKDAEFAHKALLLTLSELTRNFANRFSPVYFFFVKKGI